MAKLMAMLPDNSVATRETNHDYKFVVWHQANDGSYYAWSWTAHEYRRDQLLKEGQASIGFGSIQDCGFAPVAAMPKKPKKSPHPRREKAYNAPLMRFAVPAGTTDDDIKDMARYASAEATVEKGGVVVLSGKGILNHWTAERARSFGWRLIC